MEDDGDLRGVVIYRTESVEAEQLSHRDPMVEASYLKPEVCGWMTGKGVLPPDLPLKSAQ